MASSTDVAHGAAEHGSGGLPQLDFSTWFSQIVWLVVALVGLYWLLTNFALPRISGTIEERADAIASDLDRADEFRRKAVEAEEAYDGALRDARAKAQEIAAETRAEIQKDVDAAIALADAEISAKVAESEERIGAIRDSAIANIEAVALETTGAVVEAIVPGASESADIETAVRARLN